MNPLKILIVDDEPAIQRFLKTSLSTQGYLVIEAESGEAALEKLKRNVVDVIVLDLGLPGLDGFEVLRLVRGSGSTVPVIVLSVRADEAGKVKALDLGADDYVTKPFGIEELLARIRAAMRHRLQQEGEKPVFKSGDLTVDLVRRIVMVEGREVKLTPRECRCTILAHLYPHAAPETGSRSRTATPDRNRTGCWLSLAWRGLVRRKMQGRVHAYAQPKR